MGVSLLMGFLCGVSPWIYPSGFFVILVISLRMICVIRPLAQKLLWILGVEWGLCYWMAHFDHRFWIYLEMNRWISYALGYGPWFCAAPHALWRRIFYPILFQPLLLIFLINFLSNRKVCLAIALLMIPSFAMTARWIRFYQFHHLYYNQKFQEGYKRIKVYNEKDACPQFWFINPNTQMIDHHPNEQQRHLPHLWNL